MRRALRDAAAGAPSFGAFMLEDGLARSLSRFPVRSPASGEYAGGVGGDGFREWVAAFLRRVGRGDGSQADGIADLVRSFCEAQGKAHALVHLRATFPNKRFAEPRWHRDGAYWPGAHCKKLVVSLRGAGTLFGELTGPHPEFPLPPGGGHGARELAAAAARHRAETAAVTRLARALGPQEAGVYTVGGGEDANMHSEPDMTMRRLFLAVLPGDASQVAWRGRRGRRGARS